MTTPTQKLKDHSTELRDELLSKRPATEEAKDVLLEIQRRANSYPRLVEAAQALVSANIRYQSAEIALRRKTSNLNICEQTVAFDARQAAIQNIAALLRSLGEIE